MKKDLLSIKDLDQKDILAILDLATSLKIKKDQKKALDKSLAMIFHKPSTRTRVSFEVAMAQLGGFAIKLTDEDIAFARRESIKDIALTLSRFVDLIMIRTFAQDDVEKLASFATVPVINGLTDEHHPCQILADLFTIKEKLSQEIKIAYIGDGNNIANSLIELAEIMSLKLNIACPKGYEPQIKSKNDNIKYFQEANKAVKNCNVIYTDTWTSMGQESERKKRQEIFKNYQLNFKLLKEALPEAIVMHCLPAHRGYEITDDVIDSKQSVVFDQAENRLHVQKAIILKLLGN